MGQTEKFLSSLAKAVLERSAHFLCSHVLYIAVYTENGFLALPGLSTLYNVF